MSNSFRNAKVRKQFSRFQCSVRKDLDQNVQPQSELTAPMLFIYIYLKKPIA